MRTHLRRLTPLSSLLLLAAAAPVAAQARPSLVTDLLRDIEEVESKVMGLAEAIPADKYAWRPGEGVRSTGEVFQHLAADNFLLAGMAGHAPPSFTGIDPADYKTVQAYESRKATHEEIVDQLRQSFAHVKEALGNTSAARLNESVNMFGNDATVQGLWVLTTTHMHEHLGQLIAYARSNSIVPPWSR